jgi:hypothetical protein
MTLNRISGTQEKAAHRCYAAGGDMQTPRLVVPIGVPAALRSAAQATQTMQALTLDEAIPRDLKELGYGK